MKTKIFRLGRVSPWLIIILIILIGLGIGGFFVWKNFFQPEIEKGLVKPGEEEEAPSPPLVFDTETVWLTDQKANTILEILPLTKDINKNSQSPLIIYDSGAKLEIIDFLKKLTPSPKKVYVIETISNTIPENFLSEIKTLGIEVTRQEIVDDYVLNFLATTTPLIVSVASQENFMPYASVYAHRLGGAFFNTYQEAEVLVKKNSNVSKIIYFGDDISLQSQLSLLASNYGKDFQQFSSIAEAEISLTPKKLPNTKKVVTVIHENDNSALDDDKEYWKVAPIYAAFRETMLITVSGATAEEVDESIDSELEQNIIPYNKGKEPDYLVICGHWTTIPYDFVVKGEIIPGTANVKEPDTTVSADSRYADRDEDGYYVPDVAFGRFTAYNLGDAVLLMNRGPFFSSNHMKSSEKGVWVTGSDNFIFYNVKERLEEMFGKENTYSKFKPSSPEFLEGPKPIDIYPIEFSEKAKSAKLVLFEGHASPTGISTAFEINGDAILNNKFYFPSLWSFGGCDTGPYSPREDGNVSLVEAAIQSGAVNVLSMVGKASTGSTWTSWYITYLVRGYDIGKAYLKGQKDAEVYFLPENRAMGPKNKYPQFYLIGDPLVVYGPFRGAIASPSNGDSWLEGIEIGGATLRGTLLSLGGDTSVQLGFEWGETASYGKITPFQTKTSPGNFFATIAGLSPKKTYHFRAVIKNSVGTSHGSPQTFTFPEKALSLISPNGGEKWVMGQTYDITWNALKVEKINIQVAVFQDDTNLGGMGIDLNVPASLGKYSWKIPISQHFREGNNFKVEIEDAAPRPSGAYDPTTLAADKSNDYFSIVEP